MKFFLPDWDDRVDPGFDFLTDRPSLMRDPYRDDLYAHELLPGARLYDGILVSRMALANAGPKRATAERIGMRSYLRLPPDIELLGDCGAFGYIREKTPRYDSAEMVEYYDRFCFDYGVSVDHAIVPEFADEQRFRFELTLRNASEFLDLHRRGVRRFTPIGACQGWDVHSYIEAARALVAMGYDYIALGGLARSNTQTIATILAGVVQAIPPTVRVHIFGVARLSLLPLFLELGVESVDSAAPLRQAWLSAKDNYYTLDRTYAAIRVPVMRPDRPDSTRAQPYSLVATSSCSPTELARAELEALAAVRAYDGGGARLKHAYDAVVRYDEMLGTRAYGNNDAVRWRMYRETLRDRPWKRCPCTICRELGIEVILFRGNNRNRRRGFHNLWMVRQRLERSLQEFASDTEQSLRGGKLLASTLPLSLAD